jgi:lipoprotein-releasing system ATP-binding protein
MPLLRVANLHKTYRLDRVKVPVLRGVDLSVERGEFVAVLGASGSGKSTLLHLLGGLDRPDRSPAGVIEFDGTSLVGMSSRGLDRYRTLSVGFVFQFYHLLPELTVVENVMLPAMVRDGAAGLASGGSDRRAAAEHLIEAVGLSHRLQHRPAELSGGERQRVAIARALVNRPTLLLADEPTGNLDRNTGGKILDAMLTIRASQGQTMVVVTHDEATAARADRVVRLTDGLVTG